MDWKLIERLHAGVVEVDSNWQVGFANPAAREILARQDALLLAGGGIEFRRAADRPRAERWLRECIATQQGRPLGLPRSNGRLPYLVEFVGRCESPSEATEDRYLLLVIDPAEPRQVDPAALVEILALTPAEAALASALAGGLSLQEFSVKARVTEGTARRHLERIFLKTGVERQAALVRLVLCCASPLGGVSSVAKVEATAESRRPLALEIVPAAQADGQAQ